MIFNESRCPRNVLAALEHRRAQFGNCDLAHTGIVYSADECLIHSTSGGVLKVSGSFLYDVSASFLISLFLA